ncbi:hypothetical protein NEISICOT_02508 [Neisseria sicca ATCC 29256]|uniref:Uncharacterized protein n=1 Tax=Neisseria sicca ATCC 29256 TaxID=547045 RepID=C6M7J9_NEISI|nr:hypothetical protein NEISICOT_02508 [Neisseria sicca ATCC 29256]KJJ15250.1 hypothetical protein HMPREF3156_01743 [Neisseria sp. HMSC06F02]
MRRWVTPRQRRLRLIRKHPILDSSEAETRFLFIREGALS